MVYILALVFWILIICIASIAEMSLSIPLSIISGAFLIAVAIDQKK